MFSSTITTLALLAVASVNGSPTPVDKRDPQFSVNLPNLIPVSGNFGGFNITRGPNGNSVVSFGRNRFPFGFFGGGFGGNTGTTTNTTNGRRPGRFPFFFKREDGVEKREPQFDFDFPNELPVLGDLPFGINIGQLANGNSVAHFGNATTGTQGFPFNFLNFKREGEHQLQVREPQFQFNFTNRLPVTGRFPFGLTIGQGANGNSIAFFGNATTGSRPFPFNFLPFNLKREQELAVRGEAKRAPQFDFDFSNELPVLGDLPFGINIGQLANGNSVAHFGNATTGTQSFPFNFLNFKRDGEVAARAEEKRAPQFDFDFSNELPVIGDLPFGINIGQLANGNSVAHFGNATTGTSSFPFNFLNFKRGD